MWTEQEGVRYLEEGRREEKKGGERGLSCPEPTVKQQLACQKPGALPPGQRWAGLGQAAGGAWDRPRSGAACQAPACRGSPTLRS